MIRRTRSHGLVTDRTRRETRQIENLNEKIIGRGQNANSSTRNKRANVKTRHLFIQTVFTVSRDSIRTKTVARERNEWEGSTGLHNHALESGFPGRRLRIVSKFSSKR